MRASSSVWKLAQRIPLLGSRSGRLVGLSIDAGPQSIAASDDTGLRLVLSGRDFSRSWQGRVDGSVLAWTDATHLLMRLGRLGRSVGISEATSGSLGWKAPGDGRVWGETIAVVTPTGTLDIRDTLTGELRKRSSLRSGSTGALLVVGDVLLRVVDEDLTGVDLVSGKPIWTSSLPGTFSGLPRGSVRFRTIMQAGAGLALVRYYTNYALYRVSDGRILWRRAVPTDHLPVVTAERIGFVFNGDVLILDTANGQVVAAADRAVSTLWEAQPCSHGTQMVTVDEGGHVVTVDLREGRISGVQQEKGAQFNGCVSFEGRLLVAGLDGAVWVYEPTSGSPARARNAGQNGADGMQEQRSRRSGGTRSRRRAAVARGAAKSAARRKAE